TRIFRDGSARSARYRPVTRLKPRATAFEPSGDASSRVRASREALAERPGHAVLPPFKIVRHRSRSNVGVRSFQTRAVFFVRRGSTNKAAAMKKQARLRIRGSRERTRALAARRTPRPARDVRGPARQGDRIAIGRSVIQRFLDVRLKKWLGQFR